MLIKLDQTWFSLTTVTEGRGLSEGGQAHPPPQKKNLPSTPLYYAYLISLAR
jgi:hypothetical protein